MAALLKPRFVCWESWSLQNIPTSAPSEHRKTVHLDGVFFGFSLHHLFMHLNYFRHHSALHGLERSNGWFLGFSCALVPIEWVGGRGEGRYHCTAHMHAHRNCTMIAEIERGRGFESWNTPFAIPSSQNFEQIDCKMDEQNLSRGLLDDAENPMGRSIDHDGIVQVSSLCTSRTLPHSLLALPFISHIFCLRLPPPACLLFFY